ncbi:hypothetical protein [Marinobacterium arenosum]|uniref:hypothetical protein n=1 Tax=Marinobacterium arenosum TaxID=2862496 RepID=UPI001C9883FA|nr:hypothetical protein [Marinobacterium arenosum]MBY4677687.1 hypothetical protein [Marinobacterium arenosum]
MLGIRVLMMGLARRLDSQLPNEAETLCAANSRIPLFWLLPFRPQDLHLQPTSEAPEGYPLLWAEREQMLARLDRLRQPVVTLLGQQTEALLQQWHGYLAQLSAPVLALETYELWQTEPELQPRLQQQLTLLQRLLADGQLDEAERAALLECCQLQQPDGSLALDEISLAGFGWRSA